MCNDEIFAVKIEIRAGQCNKLAEIRCVYMEAMTENERMKMRKNSTEFEAMP